MKNSEVTSEVLKKAKEGDVESLNIIFKFYKNFIYNKTKAFFINGSEKDDVLQEAMIGLLKATRKYDKDLASFSTFASLCIQRQITTAIKKANSLKNLFFIRTVKVEDFNTIYEDFKASHDDIEKKLIDRDEIASLYSFLKEHLSEFEKKIISYLISGYNYREIAEFLKKDKKIIDNSIQRIKEKIYFGLIGEHR